MARDTAFNICSTAQLKGWEQQRPIPHFENFGVLVSTET